MSLTASPSRGSDLQLTAQYVIDPNGVYVPLLPTEVKENERTGSVTVTKPLTITGTWQILILAKPGAQGRFTYKFTLKQPTNLKYSAD